MKLKTIIVLVTAVAMALCFSTASSVMAASPEDEVLQVAETWTAAINSGDFKTWSSLWWNSPETSNYGPPSSMAFLSRGYDTVVGGVKSVFEMPPGTFIRTHHNPQATILNDSAAVLTVYETLTLNPPMVTEQAVYQCRQTLVVRKVGGKWLIVHGHGSYLPVE